MRSASQLHVGVVGCGPIAQAAHFESCVKARNVSLHAICDTAEDLRTRMAAIWQPSRIYARYEDMLADPELDAVIVAVTDAFHVPLAAKAAEAGKHVLCEKPLAMGVEEAERLQALVRRSGVVFQVGHMKRFDAGIQAARDFARGDMGRPVAYKGWYCDNAQRYVMTDAVQPCIVASANKAKPAVDTRADAESYYLRAHGSHLVDTARFLVGDMVAVRARFTHTGPVYCWFIEVEFANGALGHLDLGVGVRMDWHEGFQLYGENGGALGKTYNPWYYKSSDVDIYREATGEWTRPLAADGHFYRRQLESFADAVLTGEPVRGCGIDEGVAVVKTLAAVRQSVREGGRVEIATARGDI